MNDNFLEEVEPGVLKLLSNEPGPEEIEYRGTIYYRFMDFFYIRNGNLDELSTEEVSNLCRARVKYPGLISKVNYDVRRVFKLLTQKIDPSSLLEVGAGRNPIFGDDERKPDYYVLADADSEVVAYHANRNIDCYEFSNEICALPQFENFFEMVIAVFVFHFPFHSNQILALNNRLKNSGVIVANVYRRSFASREQLTFDILNAGLKVSKLQDVDNLCRDHEYWIIGKEEETIANCRSILEEIIK